MFSFRSFASSKHVLFPIQELANIVPCHSDEPLVFVDANVARLHKDRVLSMVPYNSNVVIVECSELTKNMDTLMFCLDTIERHGIKRREEVIAIGGGVLLDVVGLAASLYRRGIPYIKIPTTLIGIVDASIAAKVAINHFGRRNRLGAFHPPAGVYLNYDFLSTLDERDIDSGLGEIFKISLINDKNLFLLCYDNSADLKNLNLTFEVKTILRSSIQLMQGALQPNLWEEDLRRYVDFGHIFSPVVEMNYLGTPLEEPHGVMVAMDCLFSSIIALNRKLLPRVLFEQIYTAYLSFGFPVRHPGFESRALLLEALEESTKHHDGYQNAPVPTGIGEYTFLQDISMKDIDEAIAFWRMSL